MTVTYYFSHVLDSSILTTANDMATASGGAATGQDTPIGTLTGYGELCANNAPGTWPAYASESATPWSGKGQLYPVSLAGQSIAAGNWTPTLRCTVAGTGASNITADLLVRVWTWNSGTLATTKQGVIALTGQTILASGSTTFTLPATAFAQINYGTNDYLYLDTLANVTSNPNGSGVGAKIRTNFSSSSSQGNNTAQIVAPATTKYRGAALALSLSGAHTITLSLATAHAPLALPYAQVIPGSSYLSASGASLLYQGSAVKLYGCTMYLSTQGGAATWQSALSVFRAAVDPLFSLAFNNGLSMIRITDFWDGSHLTNYDDATLWGNIDYCVTRAAELGMFVMMDVSAYKNVLIGNSLDWTVAANWNPFLAFVANHYANSAPSICWYNILGEPSTPVNQAAATALGAFYESMCATIHQYDNGTHLVSAGGLTHMNTAVSGLTDPAWWYAIYAAPHNNIPAYKDYSVNDLTYLSTVQSIMQSYGITKPLSCNEFGAEQEQGDTSFPAFNNTLAAGITSGATVTSLSLNTAISSTVIAGTIIGVSSTENYVVATTTSSGTSLPVQSVTASSNHSIGDSVSALGFADVGHSLGDTVDNFFRTVFGVTTSILKWNNTPRTLVATTVPGGDQVGTSSYVMWNLGFQIQGTGYDVPGGTWPAYIMPGAWAVIGNKSRADGYQPVPYPALAEPYSAAGRDGHVAATGRG